MSTGSNFSLDSKDLRRQFGRLPDVVSRKVARKAVNAGSTPILQTARKQVPVVTGTLKQSLGKKTKVYKNSDVALSMVGPRISGKWAGYHGHLVEFGHINVDGSFTPGNPFLRRSQEIAKPKVIQKMHSKFATEIEKEVAKL